ncbi:hypothetical protein EJ05DRAFT_489788 [Pseudovirgaria hyperparasitica]|uniref:Uncharacterized protein n=1 Tax=Pseudovirgaria hyperparasitica TaxID=470096 RepID=A0A6A6VSF4_9PEZI|nr:uncharacterized protein EJ05DRAFT_489788 [Pseudovirgaria hyperparasitica]KAF2753598.1 hypothetical protein EJ05DRAFT_489788 [Pseudovirgaria hyperparasitica]
MGAFWRLIPLVILFGVIGAMAYVGYQMYLYANDLKDKGLKNMEKKNVTFTKDGMKVGVKEVRDEDYADKTQNVLVNVWNNASFPAYKSPVMGWMQDDKSAGKKLTKEQKAS